MINKKILFEDKFPEEPNFKSEFIKVCQRLGISPDYLAYVINFESGFNPKAQSPASTATGLIQFLESTAQSLGTSTNALYNMSATDQLFYVEKYLKLYNPKNTVGDVYASVFYPLLLQKKDNFQITGDSVSKNKIFDVNKDNVITKKEFYEYVKKDFEKKGGSGLSSLWNFIGFLMILSVCFGIVYSLFLVTNRV